jgi:RNA polymerase sigma-70 factor (ECF subfamily)
MASMARSQPGAWEGEPPNEPDDATLVAAAQADRRAFGALYDRYARQIYRFCYTRLGSHEAAEDATAEVFLKAMAALDRYEHQTFAGWLFRIAQNVTTDARRKHRPAAPLDDASTVPDPARSPDELSLASAEGKALRSALALLPEDQRATLELQLAGCSGREIADALDRSLEAVRMLRLRAFTRLRVLLRGQY